MRVLVLSFMFLVIAVFPAFGDDKSDAENLLKAKLEAVVQILKNRGDDKQVWKTRFAETVFPAFDFNLMSKLTLGKEYWPGLSEDKKNEFTELFTKRLKESYIDKLAMYSDEKIVFKPSTTSNGKINVPTELVFKDKSITIEYKLYKTENGPKIYDVEIQGVSVIKSFRSQFYEVLKSGTIDDLISKLKTS